MLFVYYYIEIYTFASNLKNKKTKNLKLFTMKKMLMIAAIASLSLLSCKGNAEQEVVAEEAIEAPAVESTEMAVDTTAVEAPVAEEAPAAE